MSANLALYCSQVPSGLVSVGTVVPLSVGGTGLIFAALGGGGGGLLRFFNYYRSYRAIIQV